MIESIINWILGHLGPVIFAVIVITQVLRAAGRAKRNRAEQPQQDPAAATRDEQAAREAIRRRIAERRAAGGGPPAEPPPLAEARPAPSPQTTQLPDVFNGPLGRMLQELQKRAAPPAPEPAAPPPLPAAHSSAELERQAQLAERLRELEEARAATQRRAAHLKEEQAAAAQAEPALRGAAREHLLQDLAGPQSLRRALVLREVLGAPVALR